MGQKGAPGTIRAWVVGHEESWVFVVLYVGLAVILSAFISLFWLVLLVALHFWMEWVTHAAHHDSVGRIWSESLWAIKLDVGLVLFAFALTLYLPLVFGVLGLGAASRVAATGTRFLVIQRSVRAALLSVDDAVIVARGIVRKKQPRLEAASLGATDWPSAEGARHEADASVARSSATHHEHASGIVSSWRGRWGFSGWASVSFTAVSLALLLLAPLLTDHTSLGVLQEIAAELRPW